MRGAVARREGAVAGRDVGCRAATRGLTRLGRARPTPPAGLSCQLLRLEKPEKILKIHCNFGRLLAETTIFFLFCHRMEVFYSFYKRFTGFTINHQKG